MYVRCLVLIRSLSVRHGGADGTCYWHNKPLESPTVGPIFTKHKVINLGRGMSKMQRGSKKNMKARVEIPPHVAARVLFHSGRTCCVCRQEGKPVQIHHIDDDSSNNALSNLSVLCFDCHRETQIRGGFDRKLDSDQVVLFRDDWHSLVSQRRAADTRHSPLEVRTSEATLAFSTSIAEIY